MVEKRRAKGTNSVYKTADGRWVAQIAIGKLPSGAQKYKRFTGKKQSDVIAKMNEYKKTFTYVTDIDSLYVDEYLLQFMKNVKRSTLKPASYDREMRTYENIKKYIGYYQIGQLTSEIIQVELVNRLKQDGYSYSTIHKAYVLLNQCMKYALSNQKMSFNPCANVHEPSRDTFEQKDIRYLTDEEIKIFIKQALIEYENKTPRYKYGIAIVLIIYLGLRGGELTALKWKDVDFQNNTLSVTKNIVFTYDYNEDGTKSRKIIEQKGTKRNSKGRVIPLNKQSLYYLKLLKKKYGEINPNGYIVNNSMEKIAVDIVSDSYTSIANACNILHPLGIHTLRHTCASLMIRKGVDIKIVSEILGHSSVAFTYNTYVHLIDEQKARAMELLDLGIEI